MVMKEIAPVRCWNISGAKPTRSKLEKFKRISPMKLPHRKAHFNELPLWTAARVRDLKRPNSASIKLSKRLGVSESVARVIADLSGLGSKEGC